MKRGEEIKPVVYAVETAYKKVGSRFVFTLLVARRMEQLIKGDIPNVDKLSREKPITVALAEVESGVAPWKDDEVKELIMK